MKRGQDFEGSLIPRYSAVAHKLCEEGWTIEPRPVRTIHTSIRRRWAQMYEFRTGPDQGDELVVAGT